MRFLLFFFINFFLISCTIEQTNPRRDINRVPRARQPIIEETLTPENISLPEDVSIENTNDQEINPTEDPKPTLTSTNHFVLPLKLLNTITEISLYLNEERTHISIKTNPINEKLKITAGLSGVVTISDNILSITSEETTFIVETDKLNTNFFIKEADTVKKGQVLGDTTKPIIVSIKKEDKLIPLCLKITDYTNSGIKITQTQAASPNDPCTS